MQKITNQGIDEEKQGLMLLWHGDNRIKIKEHNGENEAT